jgi:hypothetical protein
MRKPVEVCKSRSCDDSPHCLFLAPLLKWPLREMSIFHLRLGIASVFVWKSTKVGADALLGGGQAGQTGVRDCPDTASVFFPTGRTEECWHAIPGAKALRSLGRKGCRFYPALFVIRTLTVKRKLSDCGARSCGCGRHAFNGSRKQPRRPRCCNQVQKSSQTRQWRGFFILPDNEASRCLLNVSAPYSQSLNQEPSACPFQ